MQTSPRLPDSRTLRPSWLRTDGAALTLALPWVAVSLVIAWVLLMGASSPAQYADSIEQYNWAHSLEPGYWKHPPLPTWLMRGAIEAMGATHWTSHALAALCLGATVLFTWRLAALLLPPGAAALAPLLLAMHHAFSLRAQVYNHNTVLVLGASAMAWAAVRAGQSQRTVHWLLFGAFTGATLLAKYQAAVPAAALVFGLWWTGALRKPGALVRLAAAGSLAALVFLPHAWWAWRESVPTLSYLHESAPTLEPMARPLAALKFFAGQLSMIGAMLLLVLLVLGAQWLHRRAMRPGHEAPIEPALQTRRWLFALVGMPVVLVAAAVLLTGFTPQRYWGMQTLQFLPLWLAWRLVRLRPPPGLQWPLAAALGIQAATAVYVVRESHDPDALARLHSLDRVMPAREIASAALSAWQGATACPLRYVSGPGFLAGLVSVYSGQYPAVLEDGDTSKSPWIDEAAMDEAGFVRIGGPMPPDQVPADALSVLVPAHGGRAAVVLEVQPPRQGCPGAF